VRHLSLFAGIGGVDRGLHIAGGFETIHQVENNRFCQRVLAKRFPDAIRFSDVKAYGRGRVEKFDVISGGSPCQDLSTLGKMEGLDGEKSRLFWEYVRIVERVGPTWLLLENVPQLLYDAGDRVLAALEEAGYACWPLIVEARALGATHERERAWILGVRTHSRAGGKHILGMEPGPEARGEMARAIRGWNSRVPLLEPGNGYSRGDLFPGLADSYARVVRDCHGVPAWMDRLSSLGNALIPQIPMLCGCFIKAVEES
jgi:DNA-cytosine methyltransferase